LGNGKFEDVTKKAGVGDPTSKSLGVAVLDYNGDGWPDLFVSNDTQPNKLYRNNRNGTFTEEGMAAGVAFGEDGVARGAMGVDAADYDRSGRPHLLVGNFSNQMLGLYHNEGNGLFVDEAPSSTVGRASLLTLTFGALLLRLRPGWLSGYLRGQRPHRRADRARAAQGSIQGAAAAVPQLGKGQFENVTARMGRPSTGRWWRAARPMPTTTTTAIWILWSPPTTARRTCSATMAATAITGFASGWWGASRIATASARWCALSVSRASSGTWCAADRVTARKAIWR
jgi:hypothetical protein